jgi:hypothetical protein
MLLLLIFNMYRLNFRVNQKIHDQNKYLTNKVKFINKFVNLE